MDDLKSLIGKVATGAPLSRDEASDAFDSMMSGEATPSQMGGLLMALRVRGETVDEITGAVTAMRAKMLPAPTIFQPALHSLSRVRACRSQSTATARCRRAQALPMCSARSASRSISTRKGSHAA